MLKQKPLAAAVNWKNEAGTSGFILQGFPEKSYVRRDIGIGAPACDAQGCRVTGPNPDIKPPTSDKVDLFYSRIQGYAKTGTTGGSSIDLRDSSRWR
jgi:hypothetical protein